MSRLRCTLLLAALTVLAAAAQAQTPSGSWSVLANAPTAEFRHADVTFVSASLGWVVNTAGEIHHTNDGGQTWTRQYHDQTDFGDHIFFRSVGFANAQVGWAGNLGFTNDLVTDHVLFETRDGGQTWTDISDRIAGPPLGGLCGLWVVNEQVAYGVGRWNGPPLFIKTTDGGQTWTSRDLRPLVTGLVDVFFFDENNGLIVGGDGVGTSLEAQESSRTVILRTTDGGQTWTPRYTGTTLGKWGWKFSFPTPDTGYVATQGPTPDGVILKTTDGGLTWTPKVVGEGLGFSGIGFATAQVGWVGTGGTYETTDGGETWHEVTSVGVNINRFRMFSDTLGYAVGRQVYKYTGVRATHRAEVPETPAARLSQNYPNPFARATTIAYTLDAALPVTITVHDLLGRHVATLTDQRQAPGLHQIGWDGTGARGERQPPGIYFYRLTTGTLIQTRRLVLLR